MKKLLVIFSVLLCVMLITTTAIAMENEPKEFRGIPWGAEPPKNAATEENKWGLMEILRIDDYSTTTYYRLLDEVSIGGVKISSTSVEYNFLDNLGFARVNMRFTGRDNMDRIRKACVKNWGEPGSEMILKIKDVNESISIRWSGRNITAMLHYTSSTSDQSQEFGELSLYLNNYYEAAEKESEKNK